MGLMGIVVFRVRSPEAQKIARLLALDRHKSYLLTHLFTGQEVRNSGQALQEEDFAINLERDGAAIWNYHLLAD